MIFFRSTCVGILFLIITGCGEGLEPLGQNEALRTYIEFTDGGHRGMFDADSECCGFPDENFDATTAMVINWHRLPEADSELDARLHYRQVHPVTSGWQTADGNSMEFWYREERVNRVVLTDLQPGSIYEFRVREDGEIFRFRTMPESLEERPLRIVMTADHQSPVWSQTAHENARMAALQKPDIFVVAGDFMNDEGMVTRENADRWALYLDTLYGLDSGYFIYEKEIDGRQFDNLIIPHVGILGNHETGHRHHIRWPACVNTTMSEPGYPMYVAANWMELLFHWPFRSEGFYSEYRPGHPNLDPDQAREGFGHGGFGKLSFGDYLLLIGMDNSQNWEAEPDTGLKDWEGNPITDRWPWFETHHSDVRQDEWLRNLLEPADAKTAGERYTHILPVWHRGLFGSVRLNMSLKNRELFSNWLPLLYRNGVKLIKEGHDHIYTRTVPLNITTEQPDHTRIEKVYYEPNTWELTSNLSQEYLDNFYSVNTLVDTESGDIVGWEYDGYYTTYDPEGMIAIGHGGWAAGRRDLGGRGGGNAGLWFVDKERGGDAFGGPESFHITTVELTMDGLTVSSFHPDQLPNFENNQPPEPIHKFRWDKTQDLWMSYDLKTDEWRDY